MIPDQHHALIHFIRHTLGCECPDEVLRSITCDGLLGLPGVTGPGTRIDVCGRLLVYVVAAEQEPEQLASLIASAIETGIADRNCGGFNRLRLVLATPDAGALDTAARQAFADCHRPDDRIHLHVVSLAQVPKVARPGRY